MNSECSTEGTNDTVYAPCRQGSVLCCGQQSPVDLLEVGTQISFPLSLPGMSEPEIVEGVIRWVRPRENLASPEGGFGVQFTLISDHFKARINQYIQQNESLFYDD